MRKARKQKKSTLLSAFKHIFGILGTIILVAVLTCMIFACLFAVYIRTDLSEQVDFVVDDLSLNQTSVIYYQDRESGQWKELQKLYDSENRTWVPYDELPENLIKACVAIEDKRFFEHQGVDWITTGKASVKLFLGTGSAGGSTITQQLIKNLTDNKEITIRRKITEIFRALQFEKNHSKEEILELYMNVIYLGEGCYGVQSASHVYFGKDVGELSLAECASLIGITNNPSLFDPYYRPANNRERQLTILGEMLEQEKITREEYDTAVAQEMVFTNKSAAEEGEYDSGNGYYSYFADQVIRDVLADMMEQTGYSYVIAKKMLNSGGYSIYCTMDPAIQDSVDEVYENLDNVPKTTSSQQLQSGIVVIDNASGDIVALSGGVGQKTGSLTWSHATQSKLSPGSSIKPLSVYGPALDIGIITPATVLDDSPYMILEEEQKTPWPKNQNGRYSGLVTAQNALSQSLNTIAVRITAQMGPKYSFHFAKEKLGLSTLVEELEIGGKTFTDIALAPMSMGGLTEGVTVRDMTTAYASIANGGIYRRARTYTEVKNSSGKTVLNKEQQTHTAMKPTTAWYLTNMMNFAATYGTAAEANLGNIAVAAKTGTTTSDRDRWFAGFTPYYTGVVWCGFDQPEEVVLTNSYTNPSLALWRKVMSSVHKELPAKQFSTMPDAVACTICLDSGLLATDACKHDVRGDRTYTMTLLKRDCPTDYCTAHVLSTLCEQTGDVATPYCPVTVGVQPKQVSYLRMNRYFSMENVAVADQMYVLPMAKGALPAGMFEAVTQNGAKRVQYCTVHTEPPAPTESPAVSDPLAPIQPGSDPNTVSPDKNPVQGWPDLPISTDTQLPSAGTADPQKPAEAADPQKPAETAGDRQPGESGQQPVTDPTPAAENPQTEKPQTEPASSQTAPATADRGRQAGGAANVDR